MSGDSDAVVTVRFLKCWSMAHAARKPWVANITSHTSRLAPPNSQKSANRVVSACRWVMGPVRGGGRLETVIDTRLYSDNLIRAGSLPASGTAIRTSAGPPFESPAHRDMLKVDLHIHTSDDPADRISYSTHELIDRAAELGYNAIAITLHDRQLELAPYRDYAATRGLVLIPGIERTIEGRHVLLLNFSRAAEDVASFE